MIGEGVVLRRVEHLEHRRRGIAAEVRRELVDLVEHEHRVLAPGLTQRREDAAGQRADVGAPVAADLRLVAHAAERQAHELAAERARDRAAERGLAHARRTGQAQDRPLLSRIQLAHRQVLEHAPLDLVEPLVIGLEQRARRGHVDAIFGALRPRQLGQPLEVGARHARLGRALADSGQPPRLLARHRLDLRRHLGQLDLLRPHVVGRLVVGLAELRQDLLLARAQDLLALLRRLRRQRLFGAPPRVERAEHQLQALDHVQLVQHLQPHRRRQLEVERRRVRHAPRIVALERLERRRLRQL